MSYLTPRCPDCPAESTPISGSGPRQSEMLFIGERPGSTENDYGRVFVGKTGQELDFTYLPLANLRRQTVCIENAVRCWAAGNRAPSDKEVQSCAHHFLPSVLARVQPSVVVLMGGSAHKIIDTQPGVRKPRVDFLHGRPFWGSILGGIWEGWLWSSYHPALGMHATEKMSDLLEDFENLGKWWEGNWSPPMLDMEGIQKQYSLASKQQQVVEYLRMHRDSDFKVMGTDTESHGRKDWSIQVSLADHTGILVRTDDRETIAELARGVNTLVNNYGWELGFHHAPADLGVCEKAGMRTDMFRDTMQEAFQLCTLPQGLKMLTFRLFGVTMRSWEDVVWPASIDAFSEWAVEAISFAEEHLYSEKVTEMLTWTCRTCGHRAHPLGPCKSKAGGRTEKCGCEEASLDAWSNEKREVGAGAFEKVLRHVFTHTQKTAEAEDPYNPWVSLHGTDKEPGMLARGLRGAVPDREDLRRVEEAVGQMPILGIGNAKLDDAIAYAVSDADHTRMDARELERRRGDRKFMVVEEDWDR